MCCAHTRTHIHTHMQTQTLCALQSETLHVFSLRELISCNSPPARVLVGHRPTTWIPVKRTVWAKGESIWEGSRLSSYFKKTETTAAKKVHLLPRIPRLSDKNYILKEIIRAQIIRRMFFFTRKSHVCVFSCHSPHFALHVYCDTFQIRALQLLPDLLGCVFFSFTFKVKMLSNNSKT